MSPTIARLAVAALVAATTVGATPAAAAAHLQALPASVRVNIARDPISYAVFDSSGALTATAPDGRVLYSGRQRVLVRTNVRRLEAPGGIEHPPPASAATPEERPGRLALLREERLAAAESAGRTLVTVPFEFGVLADASDDRGTTLLSANAPVAIRFTVTDGFLELNGRYYRGTLELARDDDGDLIVVNTVSAADYLASVVGAEEPSTWEPEALAAQAIAARTYLLTHLRRHDAYDLEGDTRDQEYKGIGSEASSTVRAVQRTAGLVATYRGAAIEALYSANAGGATEDSENVFVNALPYLRSVPSPWDSIAKDSSWGHTSWEWTREFTVPQLRQYLATRGIVVGDPQRLEAVRVAPSGRVLQVRVVGPLATRDIFKDNARYYFGLRSTLFTVALKAGGDGELVGYQESDRLLTLDGLGAQQIATVEQRVDAESGAFGVVGYVYLSPSRFVFSGRGYGHGVGMSQWGAQGMALAGASFQDILSHYYRGTALTNVGGA